MIRVSAIAKSYGDVVAVKDVSFQAADGQVTTLLGANGSGKTTSFNAISGLLRPDRGDVSVDGVSVAKNALAAQALMGVFPDKFGLYKRLTTREHLAYFGALYGMSGADLDQAIADVSSQLAMSDILDRRTEGFSQGQRMKTALARTILHRPQNIVLDEPSRGLDVMSIRLLRSIILGLKSAGHCVLLSSHVMAEVELVSDHIVMIADGQVCAEGTPADLIAQSGESTLEDAFVSLTRSDLGQSL